MKPLRPRAVLLALTAVILALVGVALSRGLADEPAGRASEPPAPSTAVSGASDASPAPPPQHRAAPTIESPRSAPDDAALPTLPRHPASAPPESGDRTPRAAEVPSGKSAPGRAPKKSKRAPVRDDRFEGDRLPVDSPFDLPPMVELRLARTGPEPSPNLRRYVLRLRSLALSPATRVGVQEGKASTRTLEVAAELGRAAAPLLVHRARGGELRVQATSLEATRSIVRVARAMGGVSVALRPVRRDFADVAQTAADARTSEIGAKVVRLALEQVGVPYSWGGGNASGPSTGTCAGYTGSIQPCPATRTVGFDCSGLTLYAYAQVGITLDHYAAFQWLEGRRIPSDQLMPGDLVFFSPKADGPGHMGMYVGDGQFVHAPRTGDVVKISPLAEYARSYMGAVRPY